MFIGSSAVRRDETCRCWTDTNNVHFANNSASNAAADWLRRPRRRLLQLLRRDDLQRLRQ